MRLWSLQDWHMLHANEAWRQLTGVELQRGISTGLWESFEFISAQPKVGLPRLPKSLASLTGHSRHASCEYTCMFVGLPREEKMLMWLGMKGK